MPDVEKNADAAWDVPSPYGQAAAIGSMGGIAAPLLGGFAFTLATLVIASPDRFRFVNLTLGFLVFAAIALIAAVQFTFRTQQYAVTPTEIEGWYPDAKSPARAEELRYEQRVHRREFGLWSNRARYAYDVGILSFLCGVTAALFPPGHVPTGRIIVIALAAILGAGAEFVWMMGDLTADWRGWRARRSSR